MTQLTAEQARAKMLEAQSMDGAYKRKETDDLLAVINAAAVKGQSETTTGMLDTVVESRLRTLGYKVKWTEGYDQRDPGYTTISW